MIRLIFVILALLLTTAIAQAAYVFKAYNGDVSFDHINHRKSFTCSDCHEGPPKFIDLDHDKAHKLCLGCHKKLGVGPLKNCSDCHKHD